MSEIENKLKAKIAGLKDQQIRRQYDNTMGVAGEAFEMNTPRELNMELSGRNRGRAVAPGYKYSTDQLQAAMDASNTENMIGFNIFDEVLRRTGNPRMATQAMNVASMTPGVGTAMGLEDAYDGGLMGVFAQRTADEFNITREAMDEFAIASLTNQKGSMWFCQAVHIALFIHLKMSYYRMVALVQTLIQHIGHSNHIRVTSPRMLIFILV